MSKYSLLLAASIVLALSSANAQEREQAAHEHGVSDLTIAQEGAIIEITLEGAADNFLGFEYTPETPEQRQTALSVRSVLKEASTLFSMDAAADCSLVQSSVQSDLLDAVDTEESADSSQHDAHDHHQTRGHDDGHEHKDEHDHAQAHSHEQKHGHEHAGEHGHGHGHHGDHEHAESHTSGGHSNVFASYRYQCDQPPALTGIEVSIIEALPRHQRLRVDVISDAGASSQVITQARAKVSFQR